MYTNHYGLIQESIPANMIFHYFDICSQKYFNLFRLAINEYILVLQFWPVYPAAHLHVCELTPSVQEPPFAHGLGRQSSRSRKELMQV